VQLSDRGEQRIVNNHYFGHDDEKDCLGVQRSSVPNAIVRKSCSVNWRQNLQLVMSLSFFTSMV
jgi:hypothetical protein